MKSHLSQQTLMLRKQLPSAQQYGFMPSLCTVQAETNMRQVSDQRSHNY